MGTNSVFFLLAPYMRATLVASSAGLTTATELSLLTVLASQVQADGSQAGHTRHQLTLITMPAPTPPPGRGDTEPGHQRDAGTWRMKKPRGEGTGGQSYPGAPPQTSLSDLHQLPL